MPKCSQCDHNAPSLGQLRKHFSDAGHKMKKKPKKATPPPVETPALDAELTAITGCVAIIDEQLESLDSDSLMRVTSYLMQRYAAPSSEDAD